jgi:large subunit ribosomal protein L9
MATHIHVVLTEEFQNLGKSGELVKVRPGFARNYLLPRGLAVTATEGNVARIEHAKRVAEAKAAKVKGEATTLAGKLENLKVSIERPTGEGGKLYGSVTTRDIEEALAAQGFVVDRRRIVTEAIRTLGTHPVQVRLAPSVSSTIQVEVSAKAS